MNSDLPARLRIEAAPSATWARERTFDIALLCAAFVLGIWTRLHHLGAESLWLDEVFTFKRANMPLEQLVRSSVSKSHVPTYFVLMHYVLGLGDDEWMLRFPSALFGILKLPLIAATAGLLAGRRAAVLAMLLYAFVPTQLRYDQEARMYALQTFGTTLALLGQVWLIRYPNAAVRCWLRRSNAAVPAEAPLSHGRWAWGAWLLGVVIALYMHNTSALYLVASSAATLILLLAEPRVRVRFFLCWVAAHVLLLLAWSPWLPTLLAQLDAPRFKRREWGGSISLPRIMELSGHLFLGAKSVPGRLLTAALAVAGMWQLRRRPVLLAALLLLSLGSPLLIGIVSTRKPLLVPRLILWGGPAFYVLSACGLGVLRSRALQRVVIGVVVALGLFNLDKQYYGRAIKTDWRGAAHVLSHHPGAVGIVPSFKERLPIAYYAERQSHPLQLPRLIEAPRASQRVLRRARDLVLIYRGTTKTMPVALRRLSEPGSLHGRTQLHRVVVDRYRKR